MFHQHLKLFASVRTKEMSIDMRPTAIFDLDGTLIPKASAERTFFIYLIRHKSLSFLDLIQMIGALWPWHGNMHAILQGYKRYLRNKPVNTVNEIARTFFEPKVTNLLFPVMYEKIEMHRVAGDQLLLLSETLDIIANCFIRQLRFDGGKAGTLEQNNGKFTGKLSETLPYGMGKLEVLSELRREYTFDSNDTTLYANIYSDRFIMNAIAHPKAVNPDKKLRAYAKNRHWEIIEV
jgi:HAD superfamily hydrolase (TIGR01490 family)